MSNIVRVDAWRSLAFGSIGLTYVPIGVPLDHAMRLLHFINNTDGDLAISFDGTTDNLFIPANAFILYDLTNNQDLNESFRYEKGTQLYVKYLTIPTTGDLYLIAIYGKGE